MRRRIRLATEGKIRKTLLRHIRMLMPFVGTQGIQGADAQYAHDSAEDIGLFEVKIDQLLSFFLNEIDGVPKVCNRQAGRHSHRVIETVTGESQT